MKIVYLPLDERPCNYIYPKMLAEMTELELVVPDLAILGNKKTPADFNQIRDYLFRATKDAEYLIVSVDMLVYGGIVPSRLHSLSIEECMKRMNLLKQIKEQNPNIKIFSFNLIMRVPAYNSSEEEPDYYEQHGSNLFLYGYLTDKIKREKVEDSERNKLEKVKKEIPDNVMNDFLNRRAINSKVNNLTIDLVDQGIIDDLIIPLDDNSEYGFSAGEQRELLFKIEKINLIDKILIYPGADEIGSMLFARVFSEVMDYRPKVSIRYSSTNGPYIIPALEDRSLGESIKSHLTASKSRIIGNEKDADIILMVNSPAAGQNKIAGPGPFHTRHSSYFSEINYREFAESIAYFASEGKFIALADVATLNGGDHTLMKLLSKNKLLDKIDSYAGWNTSGNTIGTVVAHAVIKSYYTNGIHEDRADEFYYLRLVEDWGYQSIVRQEVTSSLEQMGAHYFDVSRVEGEVNQVVREKLNLFIKEHLNADNLEIKGVYMPWKRMFEIGIEFEKGNN